MAKACSSNLVCCDQGVSGNKERPTCLSPRCKVWYVFQLYMTCAGTTELDYYYIVNAVLLFSPGIPLPETADDSPLEAMEIADATQKEVR